LKYKKSIISNPGFHQWLMPPLPLIVFVDEFVRCD